MASRTDAGAGRVGRGGGEERGDAMREVVIVGVGSTLFGRQPERSIVELAVEACAAALAEAELRPTAIESFFLGNYATGNLTGQLNLAAVVGSELGLGPVPTARVEAACASSGVAFREAALAVATGQCDVALAAGAEHMNGVGVGEVTRVLMGAADRMTEGRIGVTFPAFCALVASRYLHESGATPEHLALVSQVNRANGATNPLAGYGRAWTVEEILASRLIADPLHLLDCSPISDGAAAAVVVAAGHPLARRPGAVRVLGLGQALGTAAVHQMRSLTTFPATTAAAAQAYEQAGIGPADVDVVELHDCFSAAELVDAEDLGLFERGTAWQAVERGEFGLRSRRPINPSGGLLARGHPVGATGMAQIYELTRQLRGTAANQVDGARVGLAHNLGGSGAVATVTMLGAPAA